MHRFKIAFVGSQPNIDRSQPGWNDGLLNFGYEELEGFERMKLEASDVGDAQREAATLVHKFVKSECAVEGYLIMLGVNIVEVIILDKPSLILAKA